MAGEKHKSSEEERVEAGAGDERSESEARAWRDSPNTWHTCRMLAVPREV